MILKFCEDNFLFFITHTKYFDILCLFVILFFIVLFFLVQKDEFLQKFKNNDFKRFLAILSLGLFTGFFVFLFVWILNAKSFNGCSTKFNMNIYTKIKNNVSLTTKKIDSSMIIIIGDSRMEFIKNDKNIQLPRNVEIVAKSGASFEWFEEYGLKETKKIVSKNKNEFDNIFIVVNMGVNDVLYISEYMKNADYYFADYLELAEYNSKIDLYVLSVNPIMEKKLKKYKPQIVRTNTEIDKFNKSLTKKISDAKSDNIFYCDSNNELNFDTDDGLHYTRETNRNIINYIVNKCVKY